MNSEEIAAYMQWLASEVSIQAPTIGVWIALGIVLILLLCSGFVSASEIAFFSLSPSDRSTIDEEKHPRDTKVASLLDDSERLLATILICNNLVNVAVIILLYFCFDKTIDFGQAKWLEFLVMTVLLTFLLLLFGEIIPKILQICSSHSAGAQQNLLAPQQTAHPKQSHHSAFRQSRDRNAHRR